MNDRTKTDVPKHPTCHEPALLSPEQYRRESGYRMALAVMEDCLRRGFLTQREFGQVRQILADQFSPVWGHLSDVLSESMQKNSK